MAEQKKKKGFFTRIKDWFRGMKSELKKVVWPTKKQTVNNSLVVLVTVAASSVLVWALDLLASGFVNILLDLAK